jgi:DNA-binding MarR family transcriptional regulator
MSLAAKGLVTLGGDSGEPGRVRLTANGRAGIIELIAMLKSAEADALEGFDASEVHMLKQLLRRLTQRSEAELQTALGRAGQPEPSSR